MFTKSYTRSIYPVVIGIGCIFALCASTAALPVSGDSPATDDLDFFDIAMNSQISHSWHEDALEMDDDDGESIWEMNNHAEQTSTGEHHIDASDSILKKEKETKESAQEFMEFINSVTTTPNVPTSVDVQLNDIDRHTHEALEVDLAQYQYSYQKCILELEGLSTLLQYTRKRMENRDLWDMEEEDSPHSKAMADENRQFLVDQLELESYYKVLQEEKVMLEKTIDGYKNKLIS
ncbi:hypothetical protein BASA61_006907 [Batrachochytrium salamandrivorans]|nr:hypothetical protein BASA61_006907 [Batrachochytrium salamandrivorans]KAJ1332315.1 hypothetical protein BSLG_008620 [Batrachochytrium salamandrivorans]